MGLPYFRPTAISHLEWHSCPNSSNDTTSLSQVLLAAPRHASDRLLWACSFSPASLGVASWMYLDATSTTACSAFSTPCFPLLASSFPLLVGTLWKGWRGGFVEYSFGSRKGCRWSMSLDMSSQDASILGFHVSLQGTTHRIDSSARFAFPKNGSP